MAAQKPKKRKDEINLLPEKGFESSTAGRILAWILSTFRIIVIVTEIIVMIAFLSRFWLDAQNSDLNEKIQQKQAVLSASVNFENQFKNTQKRLKIFTSIVSNKVEYSAYLKNIIESLPPDVALTNIAFYQKKVSLSGSTPNEKSIEQFNVNLNSRDNFKNFGIYQINTDLENSNLLDFTINGTIGK